MQIALDMFESAAAKGHIVANYNLAMLFLLGDGKPQNPRRALAHLTYAADKGLPQAQYDLATLRSIKRQLWHALETPRTTTAISTVHDKDQP